MPLALLALAIGGFGIGLTEFVIAGLLPDVAADFAVDEAAAGWLISGYALSVAVGAIGLTAAVTRFNRKHVLTALMVLFIAGNLVSALAPDVRRDDGRAGARRPDATGRSSASARSWQRTSWAPSARPAPSP